MDCIMSWKTWEGFELEFNDLRELLPLLNCFELSTVQLFAIWTLYNLCTENRMKFIINYFSIFSKH
jgi:hypothetical protein